MRIRVCVYCGWVGVYPRWVCGYGNALVFLASNIFHFKPWKKQSVCHTHTEHVKFGRKTIHASITLIK